MQSVEDKNINLEIVQMISICERSKEECIKWFLQNVHDINQRVLATKYLQTNKPEFIHNTALHLAFTTNNKKAFDIFLKFNSDFTLRNLNDLTIIHQVIQQSCINYNNTWKLNSRLKNYFVDAVLSAHIQFENPANPCDDNGISHFHAACLSNHVDAVEFFLRNGVSVNQAVHESSLVLPGYSPLHFAVRCSNVEVVKVLLKYGANVNLKDANGVTPFYTLIEQKIEMIEKKYGIIDKECHSSEKDHQELITSNDLIICLLLGNSNAEYEKNVDDRFSRYKDSLERDVNVHAKNTFLRSLRTYHLKVTNPVDKQGLSVLHIACTRIRNKSLIERLLSTGTDVNIVYRGKTLSIVHENSTPLHIALYNKNYEAALLLLTHGADVYAKDINNLTPLHHLLDNSYVIPESIYEILFSNSDLQNNLYEKTGLDLTHIACASYSTNVFPLLRLLNSGATINRKFNCIDQSFYKQFENFKPLQFAVNIGSTKIVDLLISQGANLFLESPTFFKNFSESYISCLKHLIMKTEHSATLQRFEKDLNLTPLHVACYNIDVDKIKDILKSDFNVNTQIVTNSPIWPGSTPLHVLLYRYFDRHENTNTQEQNFLFGLLIGKGADVTVTNAEQLSPLCLAFNLLNQGKLQLSQVSKILKSHKNFDVNPVNNEGTSHLYIACCLGDIATAKKFLNHGANVNEGADIFSSGYPSLLHAVVDIRKVYGNYEENSQQPLKALRLLLKYGANVRVVDREGNTPLHVVAENFQSNSRESLIKEMIDGGFDGTAKNSKGESAFEIILRKNDYTVKEFESYIKQLNHLNLFNPITKEGLIGLIFSKPNLCEVAFNVIQNKPRIAKTDDMGRTIIHSIFSVDENVFHKQHFYLDCAKIVDCDINAQDKLGRTVLHFVSKNYRGPTIVDLLAAGANANIIDAKGTTPLHIALQHKNTEVVFTLLNGGADANIIDAMGNTPFHIALQHNKTEVVLALLKHGADVNISNAKGTAPLYIALQHNSAEVVVALLNGGADANMIDATGNTPLHIALQLKNTEAVIALLNGGADANIIDAMGDAPLHIAIRQKMIEVIHALLRSGADPNIVGVHDGNTPLHIAVQWRNIKLVTALLKSGADMDISDNKGKTPLSIATQLLDNETGYELLSFTPYARRHIRIQIMETFATHIHKLKQCGFDLTRLDVNVDTFLRYCDYSSEVFEQQLEETKNIKIEPYLLSLYDYFSKIGAMMDDIYKSQLKCQAIKEFFKSNENTQFQEKFSEMMPILKLLHRRALKILEFIEQIRTSLNKIAGLSLPDLCFQEILKRLDKASMNNLIKSTADVNNYSSRE